MMTVTEARRVAVNELGAVLRVFLGYTEMRLIDWPDFVRYTRPADFIRAVQVALCERAMARERITDTAYIEYYALLDEYPVETIGEAIALDRADSEEWRASCDQMRRAESDYFERFEPHARDTEYEDSMGWT